MSTPAPAAQPSTGWGWVQTLKYKIASLLFATVALVAIEAAYKSNDDAAAELKRWMAVLPRDVHGLTGIVLHAWLHFGWSHLSSNLAGWWLLGGCILLSDTLVMFWTMFSFVCVVGGGLVWIAARGNRYHAGLSVELFGFFGFLIFRLWWERPFNWRNGLAVLVSVLVYGVSIMTSFFKFKSNVSWEGHLFGFLAGILFAYLYFKLGWRCCGSKEPAQNQSTATSNPPAQSSAFAAPPPAQTPTPTSQWPPSSMGWGSQFSQPTYAYGQQSSGNQQPSWSSQPAKPTYAYV